MTNKKAKVVMLPTEKMASLKSLSLYLPYSPQVKMSDGTTIKLTPLTLEEILEDEGAKLMLRPISSIVRYNEDVDLPDLFEIGVTLGVINQNHTLVDVSTKEDLHTVRVDTGYYSEKRGGRVMRDLVYYSNEGVFRVIDKIGKKVANGEYSTEGQFKHFMVRPTVAMVDKMRASLLDLDGLIEKGEALNTYND